MKLSITITFIAAVGSAAAQGSSFKLPKCAKSCLTLAASCDDTASFCSSSCFGPCLTNGCSDAYEQQQLIRACRNPFDEVVSASSSQTATTTQKPKPRPSTSPETETRTATKTPKEPEPTLLDDEDDARKEEEERLAEQRAKAIAIANANRTATANSTFPSNSSSTNGTAEEDEDSSGAATPGLTRSLTLCSVAALAGLFALFA